MSVSRQQRYTKSRRCPICGGAEQDPRDQGRRCIGFLSGDGEWARCSREEVSGGLVQEEGSDCFVHKLYGECLCGQVHNEPKTQPEQIEAEYDYRDEKGELIYQVVRKAGKKFQQRRPDPNEPGRWIWKTAGIRRVLFRLPEILATNLDETIVIVEGEKDVLTLVSRGIVATTSSQGAGKWNSVADHARKILIGRRVVIIADADKPGRTHARDIFSSLTGVAASVEALEPTKGKDITDHFEAGGTLEELIPLETSEEATKKDSPAIDIDKLGTIIQYKFKVGDHVEIAERLLVLLQSETRTILVGDERDLFGYDPNTGIYVKVPEEEQSKIVQRMSGSTVKGKTKPLGIRSVDVSGSMKLGYDQTAKPGFFSEAPAGLAFSNGFVAFSETGALLMPRSPDNRARFGYSFPYEPDAPCPQWLQFLDDIFRDDIDKAEKIAVLQEHIGASLAGLATTFQRCIVCIGEGDEGKSTFAKIVTSAFPPNSVEAIPPQEWGQEYRRALLAGKLLNTVAELPESDIIASESFKAVVSGDPITGRPIRQGVFTFKPRAGHLFLANRLPGTPDQTRGFWRRFIVIRFNRSFTGDAARDPLIGEKIIASERSSLVSWALRGVVRLLAQKRHTVPASHESELVTWRKSSDQIAAFVEDKVTFELGKGTKASVAYGAYHDWADSNGHRAVSSSKFSSRLKELGYPVQKTRDANVYPILITDCSSVVCDMSDILGVPSGPGVGGGGGGAGGGIGQLVIPKDPNTLN